VSISANILYLSFSTTDLQAKPTPGVISSIKQLLKLG